MLLDSTENKEKFLQKFLQIVVFDGWNDEALKKAVIECGISENLSNLIFPNGCIDLAEFYIEKQNQKLAQEIAKIDDFAAKKIRDKIRICLYLRFEIEQQNKLALQRLFNFYLNLKNLSSFEIGLRPSISGVKSCFIVSDFIWKLINDQSTDFNFYTKRVTLAKIIVRVLLTFFKDQTCNLVSTKSVIDAEIEKVMKFEKCKAKIRNLSCKTKEHFKEILFDEQGLIKKPQEIIKNLPFIRLFN